MSTIANAKVEHNYNRYNGYFFGCLPFKIYMSKNCPPRGRSAVEKQILV